MEILGGICIGYFLHPYINVTIKIIKNSLKEWFKQFKKK
jgi:hypothetical protein